MNKAYIRLNTLLRIAGVLLVSVCMISLLAFRQPAGAPNVGPEYSSDGQLRMPDNYREWIYLSSGFDMSYVPNQAAGHHMFDNVFVNPAAYKIFQQTGSWPDKTVFVLEIREAQAKGSINQSGNYQGTDVMGYDIHVKDETHFQGKWAFFNFNSGEKTSKMIPQSADCYSCHAAHAAVDTTFVQFYPTLLPIAKAKGTLSAAYQKETAGK
jgi:Cytochrome P460